MDFDAKVDCIGLYCPMPLAKIKEAIDEITIGEILKVEADDPAAEADIHAWAKRTGHQIIKFGEENTILTFYIKKNEIKVDHFI